MKKIAFIITGLLLCSFAIAADRGTEAEAQKMVEQALALIKSAGTEKAYKTFTEHPDGAFKDRDLYVFSYDWKGNVLAHGANPRMLGKNLFDAVDPDGSYPIRGMIDTVKTKRKGWYGPFKFRNPVSNVVDTKKAYCAQGAGETIVCVGIYLGE